MTKMNRSSPDVGDQDCPFGDEVAVQLIVSGRRVRDADRHSVMPSQGLFDDGTDVHQRIEIAEEG